MDAVTVGAIAFIIIFAGAVFGVSIRGILPERHLSGDLRDVVKLNIAVVATMSALVVSLMISSAKGAFDTRRDEVVKMSADIVTLDGMLAHFVAEAQPARDALRRVALAELNHIQNGDTEAAPLSRNKASQELHERIHHLTPQTDAQRSAQAQALRTFTDLQQTHWLLFEQPESTIPIVPDPADLLAGNHFHQLRDFRAAQFDRLRNVFRLRIVARSRDRPDRRAGPVLHRPDPHFSRAVAPCNRPDRRLARAADLPRRSRT